MVVVSTASPPLAALNAGSTVPRGARGEGGGSGGAVRGESCRHPSTPPSVQWTRGGRIGTRPPRRVQRKEEGGRAATQRGGRDGSCRTMSVAFPVPVQAPAGQRDRRVGTRQRKRKGWEAGGGGGSAAVVAVLAGLVGHVTEGGRVLCAASLLARLFFLHCVFQCGVPPRSWQGVAVTYTKVGGHQVQEDEEREAHCVCEHPILSGSQHSCASLVQVSHLASVPRNQQTSTSGTSTEGVCAPGVNG